MKRFVGLIVAAMIVLAACAPTTVTPQTSTEQIARLPFSEAFSRVTTAINTQPYPSDSGGWVITSSDQVGGFISAELNGSRYQLFAGSVPYRAFVSVALVARGDAETAVNISLNSEEEAKKLATAIRSALGL
jgi:hypothetical protein